MVTPEKLYAHTGEGMQILVLHYGAEVEIAAANNKPFRMRAGERTPSARVRRYKTASGYVWKVTDFGDEARAISPIQVHMNELGLSFAEAVLDLAAKFNVPDELNRSVNKPDIRKTPASSDQADGSCFWDIDQELTIKECKVMGPKVTAEHLKALNWYRVKSISNVRNREVVTKYSNENYPIFMRECWFEAKEGKKDRFYKIYEPLNLDKAWRFQYQPKGKKPVNYINGLYELASRFTEYNLEEERIFRNDPANEDKAFKEKKLPEAVICSGERDAICVRSLGYMPVWFNSETYAVSEEDMAAIAKYADKIYNIPDIDSTGKEKGSQIALRYIDVNTIWLPEKLRAYKDHRGNARKDFRDWMELNPSRKDFRKLLELATPARFWTETMQKNGKVKYDMDISCLHEFLNLNGFFNLENSKTKSVSLIRVTGHVVKYVTAADIRSFVHEWSRDNGCPRELRNLILSDGKLTAVSLESLKCTELDFTNFSADSQLFFFPKFTVCVKESGIQKFDNRSSSEGWHVWEDNIIPHEIKLRDRMFRILIPEDALDYESYDIEVLNNESKFFRYLINSSRIYWRKELESSLEECSDEQRREYAEANKFNIQGANLDPDEVREQKLSLISKMFAIGYMLHRYKSYSRGWAPFLMDNVIGENGQCNGGSGKSFLMVALSKMAKAVKIGARDKAVLDNKFLFQNIDQTTGFAYFDDCDEYFDFKRCYDMITSDILTEKKNMDACILNYESAPKFAFTTNYVPRDFDGSSRRRMLYLTWSDYYHTSSVDNDYNETRTIHDDFGRDLMDSTYPEADWEADLNFMIQCVEFYLKTAAKPGNVKIEPSIANIIFRKYLRDKSDNFREWAEGYFSIDPESGRGENIDKEIIREKAYEDYKRFSGITKISMQAFTKSLRGFCYTCSYIDSLNPEDLHNSGNRILRRIDFGDGKKVQKEMIYVRSKAEADRIANSQSEPRSLFETDDSRTTECDAPF